MCNCIESCIVIDANGERAIAMLEVLHTRGEKAIVAAETTAAVELAREQHANTDLVLLDIMMPEMHGYETAQAIRSTPGLEHLPIISLTAKVLEGDKDKALASGASDYIAKPVDDQLVELMRAWLGAGEPVRTS